MKRIILSLAILQMQGVLGWAGIVRASSSSAIFPMAVGNQWTWAETRYDTSGAVIYSDTLLIEIVKDTLVQGEHWFAITANGARIPEFGISRPDGFYFGDTLGNAEMKYKYPAPVNDSFLTHYGERISIVESVADTVSVPAGTFVCYRYKTVDTTTNFMMDIEHVAPGVGFVRGMSYTWKAGPGTDAFFQYRSELKSYFVSSPNVTIRVPADQPTIQAGIDAASDRDTVLVADGLYTGAGNRDLDFGGRNIVLRSEHGPGVTTIDCEGSADDPHRAFYFHSGETPAAIVDGFTIRNGYEPPGAAGGAIYCNGASPTIANNIITLNYAKDAGGAMFCLDCAPVMVDNLFLENSSDAGGAISLGRANATLTGNVMAHNSVIWEGGALSVFNSNPVMTSNTIVANSAGVAGGAFFLYDASPQLDNCIMAFNTGWAIHCSVSGTDNHPILRRCDLFGNGGDWGYCISDQGGINDNMSMDPLFCDTATGDYRIQSASVCAPANNSFGQLVGALSVGCCPIIMAGDVNVDLACTMADIIYIVNYVFKNGPTPIPCTASGDVNCTGSITAADIIYLVNYVLRAGVAPCAPCTSPMPCT